MRRAALNRWSIAGAVLVAFVAGVAFRVVGAATQEAKLTADDAAAGDNFGNSVAFSGDTLVAGAWLENSKAGAAYVFTRTGTTWTQQAKLTASDGAADDFFGIWVALDGDTAVAGASAKNANQGAAYVFTRTGTTWTQQAKLTADDAADGDRFGAWVALSGDTLVVGAWGKSSLQGAAYVFTRSGTTWTQQAKLVAPDGAPNDQFGTAVAVSGDTAVVGSYVSPAFRGAAYVFTRSGTTWTQQQKLTAADGADGDLFGETMAVSGDTVVLGAQGKNASRGAAYVFTRTGTTWTQQAMLTAADAAAGDQLGYPVAFAGEIAVAGANGKSSGRGAAYAFTRTGTTWTQSAKLTADDIVTADSFGASVAVSGGTVAAGAFRNNAGVGAGAGAAYVFALSPPPITSYFLPRTLNLKIGKPSSAKDSLVGSGYFDDAGGVGVDYASQPVKIDIGGWSRSISLTANKSRTKFSFKDGTLNFVLIPHVRKASLGLFTIAISKTPLGALVDATKPLDFHFHAQGLPDAAGKVRLTNNRYTRGSKRGDIYVPHVFPAHVIVKLGAQDKDSLTFRGGFASGGTAPATLGTVQFAFGDQFARTIPGDQFKKAKNGDTYTYKSPPGGPKFSIVVDFQRDFVTVDASKIELGPLSGDTTEVVFDAGDGNGAYTNVIRLSKDAKGVTRNY